MTDTLTTELRAKAELDEICKRLDSTGLLVAEIRGHLLVGDIEALKMTAIRMETDALKLQASSMRLQAWMEQHNGR